METVLSDKTLSDKIIRRTKLFVGQKFRHLPKISLVLSDKVCGYFNNKNVRFFCNP